MTPETVPVVCRTARRTSRRGDHRRSRCPRPWPPSTSRNRPPPTTGRSAGTARRELSAGPASADRRADAGDAAGSAPTFGCRSKSATEPRRPRPRISGTPGVRGRDAPSRRGRSGQPAMTSPGTPGGPGLDGAEADFRSGPGEIVGFTKKKKSPRLAWKSRKSSRDDQVGREAWLSVEYPNRNPVGIGGAAGSVGGGGSGFGVGSGRFEAQGGCGGWGAGGRVEARRARWRRGWGPGPRGRWPSIRREVGRRE